METNEKFCRVCLKYCDVSIFEKIQDEYLPNVIYNISGVEISKGNEPNAKICKACANGAIAALQLIIKCQESDQFLHFKVNADQPIYDKTVSHLDAEKLSDNIHLKRTESQINNFKCNNCEFQTKIGKLLVRHNRDIHGILDRNIYCCSHCKQSFAQKINLLQHVKTDHNILPEVKKHICTKCNKSYIRLSNLCDHIKQIHEKRRYKCSAPNCNRIFTRIFTLRRHFLSHHSNTTPYHCLDCDQYFKIYDTWHYHNKVVHKNQIIYCPQCGYRYRFKEKLQEHLKKEVCKHSILPCQFCQRKFATKIGLREHTKKIHRITSA